MRPISRPFLPGAAFPRDQRLDLFLQLIEELEALPLKI
jgi:hypothetical protein